MYSEILKERHLFGFVVKIEAVNWCEGSQILNDCFKASSVHIGGETIQTPSALQERYAPKYYTSLNYPLSEFASELAKDGISDPSATAYERLQNELAHCITASDCVLKVSIYRAGLELASCYGISFEYSNYCNGDFASVSSEVLHDNGMRDEIKTAINDAREKLAELLTPKKVGVYNV